MQKTKLRTLVLIFFLLSFIFIQETSAVRLKDIAHILEARDNQLMGFGLVVGLRNTGDKSQTGFTQQALTNLLSRMGVVPQTVDFKSRNVAAVMVTATLPPFVKPGQKLDVTVSSVGDSTSLQGGTLLITPLQGVDDQVYAVAQGSLLVGLEPLTPSVPYVRQSQANVGRIPGGALVEKEVAVSLEGEGILTIVLDQPDFTTANRVVAAINQAGFDASARDAGTISVVPDGEDLVPIIAKIEVLSIAPDTVAKIVVNERTGTIVIGENVVISAVAVAYGGMEVVIGDVALFTEGNSDSALSENNARYRANTRTSLKKSEGKLTVVPASPTLAKLVQALNAIGASPRDLVAILQAMKKAGAIKAELEVI